MSSTNDLVQDLQAGKISRRDFIIRALALGVSLSGIETILQSCGGGSSSGTNQPLTVVYWTGVNPPSALTSFFNGFKQKTGVKVNYFQLPPGFGDDVQKMTTYLSSGYTGLDVLWLDDFMTATFSNAGWLEPLDSVLAASDFSTINPAQLTLSTYNGHRYRVPHNFGAVIFFYRKDLFDKEGISVPKTWNELVQAGQKLTKNGVYGIGLAGKNGNTELFNEMCYWMGQVGSDPLHMDSAGGRQALKFVYDLIHTYNIAPPDTVTADYTSLQTSFENGKLAMWITWDGIYSTVARFPSVMKNYTLGVAAPPRGSLNNSTIIANWGWAISKYSQNKSMAAKFIDYAVTLPSQTTLANTGNTPSRTDALSDPGVQKALYQAKDDIFYMKNVPLHSRPITAQAQRVSDAFEQYVNRYLNNQLSLDAAVTQGQQAVNQARQG
jgi:ABC-type glycerol-3-phosphate transport system substrate-binding protein